MSAGNFEVALALVLRFEGGYVDHPADPGGATNLGITQASLAAWRGRAVSKAEVRALTRAEAADIYRRRYWDAIRADDLPAGVDLAVFDTAVNSGPARAIRLLQRALGLPADGRLGPRTLAGASASPPEELIRAFCAARHAFLRSLSTYAVFGRGWSTRITTLERRALALAGASGAKPRAASAAHALTPKPVSPPKKESPMDMTKSILASRTLWANAIGLVALGLSAFGFNTATLDVGALVEHLFQGVAAGSFVVSSVFRVLASKRLV